MIEPHLPAQPQFVPRRLRLPPAQPLEQQRLPRPHPERGQRAPLLRQRRAPRIDPRRPGERDGPHLLVGLHRPVLHLRPGRGQRRRLQRLHRPLIERLQRQRPRPGPHLHDEIALRPQPRRQLRAKPHRARPLRQHPPQRHLPRPARRPHRQPRLDHRRDAVPDAPHHVQFQAALARRVPRPQPQHPRVDPGLRDHLPADGEAQHADLRRQRHALRHRRPPVLPPQQPCPRPERRDRRPVLLDERHCARTCARACARACARRHHPLRPRPAPPRQRQQPRPIHPHPDGELPACRPRLQREQPRPLAGGLRARLCRDAAQIGVPGQHPAVPCSKLRRQRPRV